MTVALCSRAMATIAERRRPHFPHVPHLGRIAAAERAVGVPLDSIKKAVAEPGGGCL